MVSKRRFVAGGVFSREAESIGIKEVSDETANAIIKMLNDEIQRRIAFAKQTKAMVWNNDKMSPHDVMSALGTSADDVINIAALNLYNLMDYVHYFERPMSEVGSDDELYGTHIVWLGEDGSVELGCET